MAVSPAAARRSGDRTRRTARLVCRYPRFCRGNGLLSATEVLSNLSGACRVKQRKVPQKVPRTELKFPEKSLERRIMPLSWFGAMGHHVVALSTVCNCREVGGGPRRSVRGSRPACRGTPRLPRADGVAIKFRLWRSPRGYVAISRRLQREGEQTFQSGKRIARDLPLPKLRARLEAVIPKEHRPTACPLQQADHPLAAGHRRPSRLTHRQRRRASQAHIVALGEQSKPPPNGRRSTCVPNSTPQ
ncbi:hypothetical protein QF037_006627 [Streptomyces canus]|nr:hypothetical protein [Streptomyces canus]